MQAIINSANHDSPVQSNLQDLAGEYLPEKKLRRLSWKAQEASGIPSPESVLQSLRSKPRRGTPLRTQKALAVRKLLSLNQRDFARLIGTSPASVRNWEQGRTRIPRTVHKLIRIIERHPDIIADLADMESP